MNKLAATALGGLIALAFLLMLGGDEEPGAGEPCTSLLDIYTQPGYDLPPSDGGDPHRNRLLVAPLNLADLQHLS